MNAKEIKYLPSLDLLRGVASISVCLFHFVIISRFSFPSLFRDLFSYGHLGVEVFFIVSGFVIPFSMSIGNYTLDKIKIFFAKRLFRLEPPYIASIILIFFLNFIFYFSPYYHEELLSVNFKQLLFHLGYLNSIFEEGWVNQVYWSLGIEFQYYILIAFIFKFLNGKTLVWLVTYILLLFLSFSINAHSLIFTHLPFFIIGILIFRFITRKDSKYTFTILLSLTLLLILYKSSFNFPLLISAILPLPFFFYQKQLRIGRFLGNISYSLYLIHIPIGQRLIKIGIGYTHNLYTETLLLIVTFGLTVLCSYIFYKLIEKPSKKITSKFKYSINNNS